MQGNLFTWDSLATLAGASFGVYVISNVIQHVFNFNPRWFGLLLSFIMSLMGVYFAGKNGEYYILAFLNGFLIYANVVGIVEVTGKELSKSGSERDEPYGSANSNKTNRKFRTKWY